MLYVIQWIVDQSGIAIGVIAETPSVLVGLLVTSLTSYVENCRKGKILAGIRL